MGNSEPTGISIVQLLLSKAQRTLILGGGGAAGGKDYKNQRFKKSTVPPRSDLLKRPES